MDIPNIFDFKYYSPMQRMVVKGLVALFPLSYTCLYLGFDIFRKADLASRLLMASALDSCLVLCSVVFAAIFDHIVGTEGIKFMNRILAPSFITTGYFCGLCFDPSFSRTRAFVISIAIYFAILFVILILAIFFKRNAEQKKPAEGNRDSKKKK